MKICFLDANELENVRNSINDDPEFRLAARFMSQEILIGAGDARCIISVRDGHLTEIRLDPARVDAWDFSVEASPESWEKFLQPVPPPFYNGLYAGMMRQTFKLEGNLEAAFAHFWALTRLLDIMREMQNR